MLRKPLRHVLRLGQVDVHRLQQSIAARSDVADIERHRADTTGAASRRSTAAYRGVLKSALVAIRFLTPEVVAVVPDAGLDSDAFWMLTVLTNGGLVNAFCSKMPTSGWS